MSHRRGDPISNHRFDRIDRARQSDGENRRLLLGGEGLASAVAAVASMSHPVVSGELRRVSARTVYRWLGAFKRAGAAALADSTPCRTARCSSRESASAS